jgi:cell division septal protein FtsQ
LYWFGTDDRFFVESVIVEGNAAIPTDEIRQAATVAHWNIFFLRQSEIEARLSSLDGVKSATAQLELPNIVRLRVVERQPLFVWQANKQTWWVDESGRVFAQRPQQTTRSLPIVRDWDNQPRTQLDTQLVTAIQALTTALPAVKQFDYATLKGLSFQSERGWRVLFGQPEQLNAKLTLLNVLTAQLVAQKITPEYIDVRLPERAFYKPK